MKLNKIDDIKLLYSLDEYNLSIIGEYKGKKVLLSSIMKPGNTEKEVYKSRWVKLFIKLNKILERSEFDKFLDFCKKNYRKQITYIKRKNYSVFVLPKNIYKIIKNNEFYYRMYYGMNLNFYYDNNGKIKKYKNIWIKNPLDSVSSSYFNDFFKNIKVWTSDKFELIGIVSYRNAFKNNKKYITYHFLEDIRTDEIKQIQKKINN